MKVTNWGNFPVTEAEVKSFSTQGEAMEAVAGWDELIPRGLGRCYGDSSLGKNILSTLSFNRFLSFDEKTGVLHCQSGVSLEEILNIFVPRGWFPPVTPGTKFVTVGGAIASDVHGKNHHKEGSFRKHVDAITVLTGNGKIVRCTPEENAELFHATCGGMGLTGLILDAVIRLKPIETAWIQQRSIKAPDLETIFRLFSENVEYTYSVAWIDTLARGSKLGRSILLLGEHATRSQLQTSSQKENPYRIPGKRKLTVPFNLPNFTLNNFSIKLFNAFYYGKHPRGEKTALINYDSYFYPLDFIHHWNRIYGKRGFTQYQLVLPPASGYEGVRKVLEHTTRSGYGSFLSVLKYFGPDQGLLSFPMEGYTLTLDFPVSENLMKMLNELDTIVKDAGGRLYLTKDSRMSPAMFRETYAHLPGFREVRKAFSSAGKFESLQSRRLEV